MAQELFAKKDSDLIAWREGQSEVEFLTTSGSHIIPTEVKAARRARRAKSLYSYLSKYKPEKAYMLSLDRPSSNQGPFIRRALYQVSELF